LLHPHREGAVFFYRLEQEGLAAYSYLIGAGGSAAVIDPRRDCEVYLGLAERHAARIEHVFETHRHEDFVVGSQELARLTGANVWHGGQLDFGYGSPLSDGREFRLGSIGLTAIHTPGHTEESNSYALSDLETGKGPVMVFTGDILFVGSAGRLDLYGGGGREREAAEALHDSIFGRIAKLGDGVILCPAHGGGSVCGEELAERALSSLGIERRQSPVFQETDRDSWVRRRAAMKVFRPAYFTQMETVNLEGPPVRGGLPRPEMLRPQEFERRVEGGAVVVDTREPHSWAAAHIRGSYNIWLEGLAPFAGFVLPYGKDLLVIAEGRRQLEQATISLFRLGYDHLTGYLAGEQVLEGCLSTGMTWWSHGALPVEQSGAISVQGLKAEMGRYHILDVREGSEWAAGHLAGAQHIYLGELMERLDEVPRDRDVAVHCSIGHRSGVAVSILKRAGIASVTNVLGGTGAWRAAGYPVVRETE
jgi:hydroxyacylglutathione hydrolase